MNKATSEMATVLLTWQEHQEMEVEAKRRGVSQAGLLRLGLYAVLPQTTVKKLIQIRIKAQANRQQIASTACLLVLLLCTWQTWQKGGGEMVRRISRQSVTRSVRRNEIDTGEIFTGEFQVEGQTV